MSGNAQDTLSAPTLLEGVAASRRRTQQSSDGSQGGEAGKAQGQGTQSQITTRELNPFNTPTDEGGKKQERVVVQPEPIASDGKGVSDATSFLGKRLFGERFQTSDDGKSKRKTDGAAGEAAGSSGDGKQKKAAAAKSGVGSGQDSGNQAGKGGAPEDQKPKVTVKQKAELSPQQIATLAATAAAQTVSRLNEENAANSGRQIEKTEDSIDLKDLPEADREDYVVMSKMADLYPDKYKDLPSQLINAVKERKAYAAKYRAENGKDINWQDEEHADFLAKVEPQYDAKHYRKAEVRVEAEGLVAERMKSHEEELAEIRKTASVANIKDAVRAEANKATKTFQSEFAPEAEWDLSTPEGRQKAAEEDKILGPIAAKHADTLDTLVAAATEIYDSKGAVKINPEKNPAHRMLQAIANEWEARLVQMPAENTANDKGQTFVDRDTFRRMPEAERRKHWTILRNEMLFFIGLTVKKQAEVDRETKLAELEEIAKAQGWRFDRESVVTQKRKVRQNPDGIDAAGERASVSEAAARGARNDDDLQPAATETRIGGEGSAGSSQNSNFAKTLVGRLFNRDTGGAK